MNRLAKTIASNFYGWMGEVSALPGEFDKNFLLTSDNGEKTILKIMRRGCDVAFVDMQIKGVLHALDRDSALPLAAPVKTRNGEYFGEVDGRIFWAIEHLTGDVMAGVKLSLAALEDLGAKLARLDKALGDFDHPALNRPIKWNLMETAWIGDHLGLLDDSLRPLIAATFDEYSAQIRPLLSALPAQAIHGDANDYNLLVSGDNITGIFDFGDMTGAPRVCNVAIALAYAMMGPDDPLSAAQAFLQGYTGEVPLEGAEYLPVLIRMRLGVSLVNAAIETVKKPDDPYVTISCEPAEDLLKKLDAVHPTILSARLLSACGVDEYDPSADLARRKKLIGPNLSLSYEQPLKIVRGWKQYLYDDAGYCYLDAYNNVPHVGHSHPRLVTALEAQMRLLNSNTRYLGDAMLEYAERLTALMPAPLSVCYFVNSASEANELALRLARAHSGAKDMVVMEGAYHGHTTSLIDISPYKHAGSGGEGAPDWVHTLPLADPCHGGEVDFAAEAKHQIAQLVSEGKKLAGFICESLPSVGGQIILPKGYLRAVYGAIHEAGAIAIADEVQTGFGRLGHYFWGFEQQGVAPDIVVLGKPIGGGHPLAAVVTSAEIAENFGRTFEFFSTFGGNNVSAAVGLEVLNIIADEGLQVHAKEVGDHLIAGLEALREKHPVIGDVRGLGLFLGVELSELADKQPATAKARYVKNRLRQSRILIGTDGLNNNVLKIRPPMPFNKGDSDHLLGVLDQTLSEDVLSS